MLKLTRKLGKQGHSVRLTVPEEVMNELGWKIGDYVQIWVEDNKMLIARNLLEKE